MGGVLDQADALIRDIEEDHRCAQHPALTEHIDVQQIGQAGEVVCDDEGEEGVEEAVLPAQIPAEHSARTGEYGLENDDQSAQNGASQH